MSEGSVDSSSLLGETPEPSYIPLLHSLGYTVYFFLFSFSMFHSSYFLNFVVSLLFVSFCYSASLRGDTGNSTIEMTEESKIPIVSGTISINVLAATKEHLPHVNKLNLAEEYHRYEREFKELSEFQQNGEETLHREDQNSNAHRSKLDEVKRQLVESQRVDRRIIMLDQLRNRKDFRLDGLEYLSESAKMLDKKMSKENNQFKDQLSEFDAERRTKYLRDEKRHDLSQKDKLRLMAEAERLQDEKILLEEFQKKEYAKLNHPGSREHLESVWTESDGFDKGTFTPTAFFRLHDKNGDNFLDILEVEAFFIPEIRKVYGSKLNFEAREELALMREHLMPEIDLNQDDLVSLEEFIVYTSSNERFNNNEGWQTLDQFDRYSQEDLKEFAKERIENGDDTYDYYDYLEPLNDSEYLDFPDENV